MTRGRSCRYGRSYMVRRTIVAALGAISIAAPAPARAQAPPAAERAQVYSPYERQTIDDVLAERSEKVVPRPEGKIIEHIDVVRLDVFERRDLLPRWLDVFHTTTKPQIVRREVLLEEGERYRQVLVDETIRNLRQLPQLSIVLVLATEGSAPDRVRLLVITKDVWSLRSSWNLIATSGGLEQFELHPEERNLLGTHQTVSATFILEPSAYTLGLGYVVPRIATSRVALVTNANVMVNRETGSPEGSFGSLVAGQPLYSGTTEWAWDATTAWEDVEARRYVNAQLSSYVDPATNASVPFEYRSREYLANYELRRSFGWDIKHDFTLSAGIDGRVYRTDFPGANPRTVADFLKNYVPVSDTRVGPAIQYETYSKRYVRVIDFDTLALQEDYRLGHDVVLSAAPSFRALGSSRNVLSLGASAQYTFALRDGLFRVSVVSLTEPETDRIADAAFQPGAHLVSPTIAGLGRIVVDGTLQYRWRNYLNQTTYLGGGDRLRGYPTQFFVGDNFVSYNVELRSRPIEILTCQLALVGFFDAGDAFKGFSSLEPFQSLGVGMRALFPWLDRGVFRADLGFPLERPIDPSTRAPIAPLAFLVSFGQAFDVPSVAPTPVLPTEQVEVPNVSP
jgi:hypothetical protein